MVVMVMVVVVVMMVVVMMMVVVVVVVVVRLVVIIMMVCAFQIHHGHWMQGDGAAYPLRSDSGTNRRSAHRSLWKKKAEGVKVSDE